MLGGFDNRSPQEKHDEACAAIAKRLYMLHAALQGDLVMDSDGNSFVPGSHIGIKEHTLAVLKRCEYMARDMLDSTPTHRAHAR